MALNQSAQLKPALPALRRSGTRKAEPRGKQDCNKNQWEMWEQATSKICNAGQRGNGAVLNLCTRRVMLGRVAFLLGSLPPGPAIASRETLETYNRAAGKYDDLDGGFLAEILGLAGLRKQLIQQAEGRVLEVAVGTGLNLPLYPWKRLEQFVGLDLSPGMLQQADKRLHDLGLPELASLQQGNVEELPFQDSSFDTVVSTYSLCVFDNPEQALREMARVTKPEGKLLLLEHSRSNFSPLAAYQDLTVKAVAATSKGCKWNQDLPRLFQETNVKVLKMDQHLGGLITSVEARPPFQGF